MIVYSISSVLSDKHWTWQITRGVLTGIRQVIPAFKTELRPKLIYRVLSDALVLISFFLMKAESIENGQVCLLLPWLISKSGISAQLKSVTASLIKVHWNVLDSCQCFCLTFLGQGCKNSSIGQVILWFIYFFLLSSCLGKNGSITELYLNVKKEENIRWKQMIRICGRLPCTLTQGREEKEKICRCVLLL